MTREEVLQQMAELSAFRERTVRSGMRPVIVAVRVALTDARMQSLQSIFARLARIESHG